jgi:uncharacterized MnhB-related membrane protein
VNAFLAIVLTLVALSGTAAVLIQEPVRQAIVLGVMGLLLAVLFYALQAPDVALSELVIGSAAIPVMLTLAIAKIRAQNAGRGREAADEPRSED